MLLFIIYYLLIYYVLLIKLIFLNELHKIKYSYIFLKNIIHIKTSKINFISYNFSWIYYILQSKKKKKLNNAYLIHFLIEYITYFKAKKKKKIK